MIFGRFLNGAATINPFNTNTPSSNATRARAWPKSGAVCWHVGGSIIFAYFLGNAKSMSPPGSRAKERVSLT